MQCLTNTNTKVLKSAFFTLKLPAKHNDFVTKGGQKATICTFKEMICSDRRKTLPAVQDADKASGFNFMSHECQIYCYSATRP
jgi:hypothetical protein